MTRIAVSKFGVRRAGIAIFAGAMLLAAAGGSTPALAQTAPTTVILVHGAFADGSSWDKVIPLLQAKGLNVIAVQNPLTSLADDVAATQRAIAQQKGPVVLVGHSWAGTVITQAGNDDRVKALVYVAAFSPGDGQSTSDLNKNYPTPPGLAHPQVDAAGFLTLSHDDIAKYFAPDVPKAESNLIAITQGPVRGANFDEKVTTAAWKSKPSWAVVTKNDQMIDPKLLADSAKVMNAHVKTIASSHVPMLSHPKEVAAVILEAVDAAK
ncbi:alpha/beta fold hydrolase [Mesorhizobium neociceri]|uniref:Alpha/beta hydrolase n=1 Tax=Mesorhizobium neociceri TaxID=1307853 RepID=A0A838BEV0_9HYPH|nr:alpha/beta hydrolase [Mesorhizobium neociceri]MBA1144431.1 alpha/beta hydrolase [Mesorhizobium neociceri]